MKSQLKLILFGKNIPSKISNDTGIWRRFVPCKNSNKNLVDLINSCKLEQLKQVFMWYLLKNYTNYMIPDEDIIIKYKKEQK